jgi:hypothetical protein
MTPDDVCQRALAALEERPGCSVIVRHDPDMLQHVAVSFHAAGWVVAFAPDVYTVLSGVCISAPKETA